MDNNCFRKWVVGDSGQVKANCPHVGSGPTGGVPFMGVFPRDPRP